MVATKPQIRSMFATPVCVHFHPVAQEANAELRPLILEKAQNNGNNNRGEGWRSPADFESWGGDQARTLFRVLRDLADSLTATRAGGRVTLDWKITAAATIRQKGQYQERAARPGAFWAGVYYVDDGYQKSDDEALGGECELADPRGVLPAMIAPLLGFRVPNGLTAGQTETIRPQSGMIILHPAWQPRGERRYDGNAQRIAIEFELAVP
ncbi:MAG TPA: putative 2OG-Fe(II) oxygenase [Rhizomicrobium sp.]